ncbi:hypothetical protein T11_10064 [Trichinella zimbabwensis]|uniref:Uncharacterized protein n=1 Tax=Trichinella zimbabwensis TaxID=268475 RepID=A0A0V1HVW7_9BILA|nr:hypothetical protein T11_10064 [Trichinella zimbabwensis]
MIFTYIKHHNIFYVVNKLLKIHKSVEYVAFPLIWLEVISNRWKDNQNSVVFNILKCSSIGEMLQEHCCGSCLSSKAFSSIKAKQSIAYGQYLKHYASYYESRLMMLACLTAAAT